MPTQPSADGIFKTSRLFPFTPAQVFAAFADADRLVAVRSEELREGDDFRIIAPENAVERPYSRMIGPQSGENAGACRAA